MAPGGLHPRRSSSNHRLPAARDPPGPSQCGGSQTLQSPPTRSLRGRSSHQSRSPSPGTADKAIASSRASRRTGTSSPTRPPRPSNPPRQSPLKPLSLWLQLHEPIRNLGAFVHELTWHHVHDLSRTVTAGEPSAKIRLAPQALQLLLDGVDLKQGARRAWYECA